MVLIKQVLMGVLSTATNNNWWTSAIYGTESKCSPVRNVFRDCVRGSAHHKKIVTNRRWARHTRRMHRPV